MPELPSNGAPSLFLSPHFDDVALSCGGTVFGHARKGSATVATVFAAQPTGHLHEFAQFQHQRWGTSDDAVDSRRAEDVAALTALGATPYWLDFQDAIYRGDLYQSDDDLFGDVKAADAGTASEVREAIGHLIARLQPSKIYAPLGVGGHVDHRLVRQAALATRPPNVAVFLFEDFPYAVADQAVDRARSSLDVTTEPLVVDVTHAMTARLEAIASYASQLPTIFRHFGRWDEVVRAYAFRVSGRAGHYAERLWRVE